MQRNESPDYEVEVRAHIPDTDFDSLLKRLTGRFGAPSVTDLKTFLFPAANGYARIRILRGQTNGILTEKIGGYADMARQELNRQFNLNDVDQILMELKQKGFSQCSYLRSTGYAFRGADEQELFLSRHEGLGIFLEVEMITHEQSQQTGAYQAVTATLAELNLEALPAEEYQMMMDSFYARTLARVADVRSEIALF